MPPNLRKPQLNLSKPSEGGSFNAERKPASEQTNPLKNGLNLTAERELGTVGGVKSTARLTVGTDQLIGQQGVDIEIDAVNRTAGFGAGIGSTKGKLGVNIGGKIGYDEDGKISIKGAEAGINIGGFGGSASIDEDEGIRGSISVAGAKVEVGISKDGKKTVSLCYGVPGGELCVTFEPDPGITTPPGTPTPTPTPTPIRPPVPPPPPPPPIRSPVPSYLIGCTVTQVVTKHMAGGYNYPIPPGGQKPWRYELITKDAYIETITTHYSEWEAYNENYGTGTRQIRPSYTYESIHYEGDSSSFKSDNYKLFTQDVNLGTKTTIEVIQKALDNAPLVLASEYTRILDYICPTPIPPLPLPPPDKIQLPNYPQYLKPMDCCDQVKEIYKFLGIAKLKKNKFPVSNAFLAPGGTGNENCIDYYSIAQALFRMLANGLIINPKSKPLGSEWQSSNATAWASDIYAMAAESMSDGNTSQRFEVAAMMQLAQMMGVLAENGRKIEFIADGIGFEPLPVTENIPICFTIYEGHKGFGKKEPKKINVSGLKTDNEVENVLGKMLSPSQIPIVAWKFKPGQISLSEALRTKNG